MDKTINTVEYLLSLEGLFSVLDVLLIVVLCLYIFFAFLLTRQVKLLNRNFSTPLAGTLDQAVLAHLILAIGVTLMAIISL